VEFVDTINKCNNSSTLVSDYISWSYIRILIKDNKYTMNIISIANSYINLGLSQISYLLVVILELNGVSEVQYKEIMIIGNE